MNHNEELDRTLDQALNEYRDAEPLAGMEDRILRRIAARPETNSRRWMWVFAAAAAAAMIVIALWLGLRERPHQQLVATNVAQPAKQATTSTSQGEKLNTQAMRSQRTTPVKTASRGRSSAIAPQLARVVSPKLAPRQFPTRTPMSAEEHALLALARTHPDALPAQADDANALSIAPIEIKPLVPETGAPQGEQ